MTESCLGPVKPMVRLERARTRIDIAIRLANRKYAPDLTRAEMAWILTGLAAEHLNVFVRKDMPCPDSDTGLHEYVDDEEYDPIRPPSVCHFCGKPEPKRKKGRKKK